MNSKLFLLEDYNFLLQKKTMTKEEEEKDEPNQKPEIKAVQGHWILQGKRRRSKKSFLFSISISGGFAFSFPTRNRKSQWRLCSSFLL